MTLSIRAGTSWKALYRRPENYVETPFNHSSVHSPEYVPSVQINQAFGILCINNIHFKANLRSRNYILEVKCLKGQNFYKLVISFHNFLFLHLIINNN